jgi:calcium/calmodulin-dependent protein kinase I
MAAQPPKPQVQPCRYKTGKTLGAGSYSVVKECVHIDTGRYYAAKVINKRLMAGREHMVSPVELKLQLKHPLSINTIPNRTGLQVRNEIAVLKRVSMGHQNILTLVDYFETMNNRTSPHRHHTLPSQPNKIPSLPRHGSCPRRRALRPYLP